jgi:hypothetical protein
MYRLGCFEQKSFTKTLVLRINSFNQFLQILWEGKTFFKLFWVPNVASVVTDIESKVVPLNHELFVICWSNDWTLFKAFCVHQDLPCVLSSFLGNNITIGASRQSGEPMVPADCCRSQYSLDTAFSWCGAGVNMSVQLTGVTIYLGGFI